jgi:hypothetical protein
MAGEISPEEANLRRGFHLSPHSEICEAPHRGTTSSVFGLKPRSVHITSEIEREMLTFSEMCIVFTNAIKLRFSLKCIFNMFRHLLAKPGLLIQVPFAKQFVSLLGSTYFASGLPLLSHIVTDAVKLCRIPVLLDITET